MPSQTPGPENPFAELWESEIPDILRHDTKSLVTNAGLLDTLLQQHPHLLDNRNRKSMLKTLGRQVTRWRTDNGHSQEPRPTPSATHKKYTKPKGMIFPQEHPPGHEAQAAFTNPTVLGVTIQGHPYQHLLYNFRLSHSGWCYVQVTDDDIPQAVAQCMEQAIASLGRCPSVLRTDYTNAAIQDGKPPAEMAELLQRHHMTLSLANRGRPWEIGGVRSGNRGVKRALEQALIIRGNRDFAHQDEYRTFVQDTINRRNARDKVAELKNADLAAMRPPIQHTGTEDR